MKSLECFQKKQRYTLENRKLLDKHREVLRLIVSGFSDVQIAEHLGLTSATVLNIRKSDAGQRVLAILQASRDNSAVDVQERIQALSNDAMDVIESALKQDGSNGIHCAVSPKDRAKIAFDILDRAGHKPVQRVEQHHSGGVVSFNLLANLDQRAKEEEAETIEVRAHAS